MADDWKSPNFRQSIVQKIGEMLRQGNLFQTNNPRTNPTSLENHIFSKSNSREEYVQYATKLISHFRNQINQNQNKMQQQQQQHKEMEMAAGQGGPPNMIPDPINALQNLASQGSRPNTGQIPVPGGQMQQGVPMQGGPNNINASNLLQTLNQQRPGQQPQPNQQMQRMGGQMGGQQMMGPNQMNMNNMNMMGQQQPQPPQNQMQMQNQMGGGGMNQMQMNQMNINQMNPMMANRMGNQPNMNVGPALGNQIQMQGNMGNMPNQGPGMMANAGIGPQGTQGGNMQQMMSMQQKQQANMGIPQQGNMYRVNPNTGQNFLPQSPNQNVPSPAQQMPNQPPQLPNPQMIPSPALVPTSSPQMPMMNNQRVLMQSPSQPLNTPGQPAQSPYNAQEDIIYREKYKYLTKYIEPLQKMVAKIGNEDNLGNLSKMTRLLEILSNPQQRIPLETLLKCEKALERMDILGATPSNKHHFLETVSTVLQTPTGHHTLYRTFHPSYESLFGTDIKLSSPAAKKKSVVVEETQETPHVLQGEIARLDQKFKVTLDPSTQNQNKTLTLNCCLDDKCLPWVPPICVTIPENYPFNSPTCTLNKQEYTATPFLISVEKSLASRIGKLPKLHSLSHILDTWEMSVRQACSPTSAAMTADDVLADILAF